MVALKGVIYIFNLSVYQFTTFLLLNFIYYWYTFYFYMS